MSANASSLPHSETPAAPINHFARISGVFFSPKQTFADIVAAPSWLVPLIVLTVCSLIACVALNQRMDWRQFAAQQIEPRKKISKSRPSRNSRPYQLTSSAFRRLPW